MPACTGSDMLAALEKDDPALLDKIEPRPPRR